MEKIIERVKKILLTPKDALNEVKTEELTIVDTMKEYVAILAAISAVALFIGLIGRLSFIRIIVLTVLVYILGVAGVFVFAKILDTLASSFNTTKNELNSFKLAVYTFTPIFIAGIFNINPSLSVLSVLGALYGMYILYLGIPNLMETPQEKAIAFTIVSSIVSFIIMLIIWAFSGTGVFSDNGILYQYY